MPAAWAEPGQPGATAPPVARHMIGLDLVRFAAASLVMIYHVMFFYRLPGLPLAFLTHQGEPGPVFSARFGWIGVEIFFVISGLVIGQSARRGTAVDFVINRALRLLPGVWICATLALLIYLALGDRPVMMLGFAFVDTILFWPFNAIDGVYWTLGVEVSFYLLVAFLIRMGWRKWIDAVILVMGYGTLCFWATVLTLEALLPAMNSAAVPYLLVLVHKASAARIFQLFLVQHSCFFALGVLIRKTDSAFPWHGLAMCVACSLEIVGQNDLISRMTHQTLSVWWPLVVWWVALACIVISARRPGHGRLPAWVIAPCIAAGRLTYPLYLSHIPVTILFCTLLQSICGAGAPYVAMAGAMLVARVIDWRVEPPLRSYLQGWVNTARFTTTRKLL